MIDIWSSLIDISMILEVKLQVQIGDELCGSLSLQVHVQKRHACIIYKYNIL